LSPASLRTSALCRLDEGPSSAGHLTPLAFQDMSKPMSQGGIMRQLIRLSMIATAVATALLGGPAVLAHAAAPTAGANHAVFVQTDDPAGNSIVAYARHDDGTLTFAGNYATGGNGARAAGAAVDPLASQGGLVYRSEE